MTTPSGLLLGEPTQVVVNPGGAQQIMTPFNGDVMIYNMDANNTVYVGYRQGLGITNAVTVQPETPVVISAKRQLWAFAVGGPALINVTPGGSYQGPGPAQIIGQLVASTLPSLIASAVQAAGVPPIDNPATVFVVINQDVPASGGGTFATGHINMAKYQSYALILKSANIHNNADTIPYMRVTLSWSLQSDNYDPVHVEDWIIPTGPFSFTFTYPAYGSGPCYSDTLDITVSSYDTVINSVTIGVFGSFRTRTRSILNGVSHFLAGGAPDESRGLGTDGVVDSFLPAFPILPGGQSSADLMNLFSGPVSVSGSMTFAATGAANFNVRIRPQPTTQSSDIVIPVRGTVTGSQAVFLPPTTVILPRRVCTILVQNDPSSASNIINGQLTVTSQEYPA
jgi:hypothetical protein